MFYISDMYNVQYKIENWQMTHWQYYAYNSSLHDIVDYSQEQGFHIIDDADYGQCFCTDHEVLITVLEWDNRFLIDRQEIAVKKNPPIQIICREYYSFDHRIFFYVSDRYCVNCGNDYTPPKYKWIINTEGEIGHYYLPAFIKSGNFKYYIAAGEVHPVMMEIFKKIVNSREFTNAIPHSLLQEEDFIISLLYYVFTQQATAREHIWPLALLANRYNDEFMLKLRSYRENLKFFNSHRSPLYCNGPNSPDIAFALD